MTPTTDRIDDDRAAGDNDPARTHGAPCPTCGTPGQGEGRFCESCGADLDRPGPDPPEPPDVDWVAEVTVDADRCADDASDGLVAPTDRSVLVIPLVGRQVTIGRRHRDGDTPATIDLSGDRSDPGVSRRHATIDRDAHGTWRLTDDGSTNGTSVDDDLPIPPHLPVPLTAGSRIHIGAWTTITLRATPMT